MSPEPATCLVTGPVTWAAETSPEPATLASSDRATPPNLTSPDPATETFMSDTAPSLTRTSPEPPTRTCRGPSTRAAVMSPDPVTEVASPLRTAPSRTSEDPDTCTSADATVPALTSPEPEDLSCSGPFWSATVQSPQPLLARSTPAPGPTDPNTAPPAATLAWTGV